MVAEKRKRSIDGTARSAGAECQGLGNELSHPNMDTYICRDETNSRLSQTRKQNCRKPLKDSRQNFLAS
jgi:hypothetical protein